VTWCGGLRHTNAILTSAVAGTGCLFKQSRRAGSVCRICAVLYLRPNQQCKRTFLHTVL
jgi:hypothetical protein